MKVAPGSIIAAQGVEQRKPGEQGGDDQHPGGQSVGHQDDAKGRGPVAECVDQNAAIADRRHERQRQPDLGGYGQDAQDPMQGQARLRQQ